MNTTQQFHDRMNNFDIENDVESDFKHSRYFDGLKQNYCSPNQKIDVSGLDYSFGQDKTTEQKVSVKNTQSKIGAFEEENLLLSDDKKVSQIESDLVIKQHNLIDILEHHSSKGKEKLAGDLTRKIIQEIKEEKKEGLIDQTVKKVENNEISVSDIKMPSFDLMMGISDNKSPIKNQVLVNLVDLNESKMLKVVSKGAMEEESFPQNNSTNNDNEYNNKSLTPDFAENRDEQFMNNGLSSLELRRRYKRNTNAYQNPLQNIEENHTENSKDSISPVNPPQEKLANSKHSKENDFRSFSNLKGELEEITKPLKQVKNNDSAQNERIFKKGILKQGNKAGLNNQINNFSLITEQLPNSYNFISAIINDDEVLNTELANTDISTDPNPTLQSIAERRMKLINRAYSLLPEYLAYFEEKKAMYREELKRKINFDFEARLDHVYLRMVEAEKTNQQIGLEELNVLINDTFKSILFKKTYNMMVMNQDSVIAETLNEEMISEIEDIKFQMSDLLIEMQAQKKHREQLQKQKFFWELIEDLMGLKVIKFSKVMMETKKFMGTILINDGIYIKFNATELENNELVISRINNTYYGKRNTSYNYLDPEQLSNRYIKYEETYNDKNVLLDMNLRIELLNRLISSMTKSIKKYPIVEFLQRVCSFVSLMNSLCNQIQNLRLVVDFHRLQFDGNTNQIYLLIGNTHNPRILNRYDIDIINEKSSQNINISNITHNFVDRLTGMSVDKKYDITELIQKAEQRQLQEAKYFLDKTITSNFVETIRTSWNKQLNSGKVSHDLSAYVNFMNCWEFKTVPGREFGTGKTTSLQFVDRKNKFIP